MSQVVSGVKEKLDLLYPGQIGDNRRWSTAYIESLIDAADKAVCERCDIHVVAQSIPLVAGQEEYDLDSNFISITSVEYMSDGSNVDGVLKPATHEDLDHISVTWRADTGTWPTHYILLSAPGMNDGKASTITIYRPMSVVTNEAIRVVGTGQGDATDYVDDDIQYACYIPFIMSQLALPGSMEDAYGHYRTYLDGCAKVREQTMSIPVQGIGGRRP